MERHTLGKFDDALRSLRDQVLMMASLTDRMLTKAGEGLFSRSLEACDSVVADDAEVDALEKSIDEDGVGLMIRYQPMANDLRDVVAAMKVSSNLERAADQAVSIARRARRLCQSAALPETAALGDIFRLTVGIYRDSVRSFADRNESLAREIKPRDRELDALHHQAIENLTKRMAGDTAHIKEYLDLVLVARNLERIGDHATNIAEDAVFVTSAEDIRHTAPAAGH